MLHSTVDAAVTHSRRAVGSCRWRACDKCSDGGVCKALGDMGVGRIAQE